MITQTLQLNLVPKGINQRLYATQYDYGSRSLQFEIYNGNERFTLTSGMSALIEGTKPDRHGFSYSATVNTTSNIVEADLTQQMTAVEGDTLCEIVITKSGERIGTLNFVLAVQAAGVNDNTVVSDTEIPAIIDLAREQVLDAEAWANGTRNGVPIGSSDPAYEKNAKYYADNFVGCITDAQWSSIVSILS